MVVQRGGARALSSVFCLKCGASSVGGPSSLPSPFAHGRRSVGRRLLFRRSYRSSTSTVASSGCRQCPNFYNSAVFPGCSHSHMWSGLVLEVRTDRLLVIRAFVVLFFPKNGVRVTCPRNSEMAAAPIRIFRERRRVRLLNSSLLEAVNQLLPSLLTAPRGR